MAKDSQKSQLTLKQWPAYMAIGLVRAYQLAISPWLGSHCRFSPSCSHYAIEAYQRFGWWRGSWMTLKRVAKCHPWHAGGIDEVVTKAEAKPETEVNGCHQSRGPQ